MFYYFNFIKSSVSDERLHEAIKDKASSYHMRFEIRQMLTKKNSD